MSLKDATLSIAQSILSQYVVIKRDFCSDMFKTIISVGTRMPNKRSLATIVRNSNFLILLNRVMKNSRYDVFCLYCCDIFESSNYILRILYYFYSILSKIYYSETWINLRAIINYFFFFFMWNVLYVVKDRRQVMKRNFNKLIMFAYLFMGALAGVFVNHRPLTVKVRSLSLPFSLPWIFYAVLRSWLIRTVTTSLAADNFLSVFKHSARIKFLFRRLL